MITLPHNGKGLVSITLEFETETSITFQYVTLYQKLSSSVMLCGCVHIDLFPVLIIVHTHVEV